MIVYYVSNKEKPENPEGVRFFTDYGSAKEYSLESHKSIYQFNVNEKCDTDSFGMDTQMVFLKDRETGELKFFVSGRWLEVHEILNIPFYYDLEDRSDRFVSMSLRYFNSHYRIVPVESDVVAVQVPVLSVNMKNQNDTVLDSKVLSELFGGVDL